MYLELLSEAMVRNTLHEVSVYHFSDDEIDRFLRNFELTRKEDFLWYAVRHASAYVDMHVCGRRAIAEMEKNGVPLENLESCIDSYYSKSDLIKRSDDAHWWGLYFSPMVEGEAKPKVWVRFPDSEKLIWFFIEEYNDRDGLVLSPNPRRKSTMNLFKAYKNEFKEITLAYPKTIEYARNESYDHFKNIEERRPSNSNENKRIGFLVYPFPVHKQGDKHYTDVAPQCRDDLF